MFLLTASIFFLSIRCYMYREGIETDITALISFLNYILGEIWERI